MPAPRTAFCRLYIDVGQGPTYFGLYAMTEIPDNPMLQSQFGDDSGNLYKPESNWVTFNQDDFDKESNKDAADFSDVQAAIAALHAGSIRCCRLASGAGGGVQRRRVPPMACRQHGHRELGHLRAHGPTTTTSTPIPLMRVA